MVFEEKQAFLRATAQRLRALHVDNINAITQDPQGNFDVNQQRVPTEQEKPSAGVCIPHFFVTK